MIRIGPRLQTYAWGQTDAITRMLGLPDQSGPVSEAWFGAHESAPSAIDGGGDLAAFIAADPEATVGAERLPYLLKVLAVATPLSLQVHPTDEQARAGFDHEQRDGVPLAAPARTFRDPRHKPELIVAVTPMRLLVGMRPAREVADDLHYLGADDLLPLVEDRESLLTYVMAVLSGHAGGYALARLAECPDGDSSLALAARAARAFPADPGALVALAMNAVTLEPGESCYVAPRVIHSYQSGIGVEIMANSDNVVRGGLTPKAVDVERLEAILDAEPAAPHRPAVTRNGAATTYSAPVDDFCLVRIEGGSAPTPAAARIVFSLDGAEVATGASVEQLAPGQALFVPLSDGVAEVRSDGVTFVAMPGQLPGGRPGADL